MESQTLHMDKSKLRALLGPRGRYAHKGSFGKLLLICGSVGYTGAAALAARAALRTGAGLITLCVPQAVYPILAAKLDEPIVVPMPCDAQGRFSEAALPPLTERLAASDACLIGPGLGRSGALTRLIEQLLRRAECPVVLDADGINAMRRHIDVLRETACPLIVTPHDGEFLRLEGSDEPLPQRDLTARRRRADALAERLRAVVVLKGHRTVITDGARAYLNETGNPGMATGGSGDVLAGILVSFLGQGLAPLEAAAAAAWLHGAAGDVCARQIGECGLTPSDMIFAASRLLKQEEGADCGGYGSQEFF